MGKLKTAKHVREEILGKYFKQVGYFGDAFTVYRGRPPRLQNETCFGERHCLDIVKERDEILNEILNNYFRPTKDMRYEDFAGNVYMNGEEALESLENDLYNQSASKKIKSSEAMANG